MELKYQQILAAPLQSVYDALNDPEVLRQCIPGCEAIEKISDSSMNATVTLKIGPIKASFVGELEISDLIPPTQYTLNYSGKGGTAGDASGSAKVMLESQTAESTSIDYEVNLDVTGKIAQVGNRLISSTAKVLANRFFKRFAEIVESAGEAS